MTNVLEISSTETGEYTPLPVPSMDGYECTPNELVKANRNAYGNLYKYRINVKRSIMVSWNALSHDEYVDLIQKTSGASFWLKYWDMQEMTVKTGKFYRGNDLRVIGKPPFKDEEFAYYVVSMSFEEF